MAAFKLNIEQIAALQAARGNGNIAENSWRLHGRSWAALERRGLMIGYPLYLPTQEGYRLLEDALERRAAREAEIRADIELSRAAERRWLEDTHRMACEQAATYA